MIAVIERGTVAIGVVIGVVMDHMPVDERRPGL